MLDDCLRPEVRLRGRRRQEVDGLEPCTHPHVVGAFAYRLRRDEHWPIAYCDECLEVLTGRDPLLKLTKRPRWRDDERNRAARSWVRQWPRPGRPRRRVPPVEIAWPDAA